MAKFPKATRRKVILTGIYTSPPSTHPVTRDPKMLDPSYDILVSQRLPKISRPQSRLWELLQARKLVDANSDSSNIFYLGDGNFLDIPEPELGTRAYQAFPFRQQDVSVQLFGRNHHSYISVASDIAFEGLQEKLIKSIKINNQLWGVGCQLIECMENSRQHNNRWARVHTATATIKAASDWSIPRAVCIVRAASGI
ncbi:hypothetical protein J6590_092857 [Homalodisca vitripennis]|nr:hypothetical protein J6590_092857 [Homalodisca vitripennis]